MKHALIILAMLAAMLAAPPVAQAQTRVCADLDFRTGTYGWTLLYGEYVAGEGLRTVFTTAENVYASYTGSLVVDRVEMVWYIDTWSATGTPMVNRFWITDGETTTYLIEGDAFGDPQLQTFTWSGWGSTVPGDSIGFQLFASDAGGSSSAVGYVRSLQVCGRDLPSGWSPYAAEPESPWATDEPWSRPTPTPWPTPEATLPFGVREDDLDGLADTAINLYNFANQQGALDTLIWILMVLLILGLIFRFMKKAKAES